MGFPPVRVRQSKLRVLEQGLLLSSVLFQVCATCTREKGTEKGKEEGREGGREGEERKRNKNSFSEIMVKKITL
jgi:predicted transposase YdaD